jgi:hypothetical protein
MLHKILIYFPSIACIASSASARCLKFTKAKQGGFVAIHTSLIVPNFEKIFSISRRDVRGLSGETCKR